MFVNLYSDDLGLDPLTERTAVYKIKRSFIRKGLPASGYNVNFYHLFPHFAAVQPRCVDVSDHRRAIWSQLFRIYDRFAEPVSASFGL